MNLDIVRPENETEDLLLSISKNCETLIEQTHTKLQETLDFEIAKPRKTFSNKRSINLGFDSNCMVGLTKLEV